MLTPTFKAVSGEGYSIQNMKVVGDDVYGYGEVSMQLMDGSGSWNGLYYWYLADTGMVDKDGWYDEDVILGNVTLSTGDSVFMSSDVEGAMVQVAGEVELEPTVIFADSGYKMLGNATPVTCALSDIAVSGDDVYGFGEVNIQIMDESGSWTGLYYWYTADTGMVEKDGWYDEDVVPADYNLESGKAVFLSSDVDGVAITLPSPISAK